jgi:acyl dehydratase
MIDRAWIGFTSKARTALVEAGQLKFFALATGETNPIYFDLDAARAAGHPALLAPPTFVFCLASSAPPPDIRLADMGIDTRRILHAEQSFRHHSAIWAGDTITLTTRIADIWEKKGGALEFIAQETEALNQNGKICALSRSVLVVRHQQGVVR